MRTFNLQPELGDAEPEDYFTRKSDAIMAGEVVWRRRNFTDEEVFIDLYAKLHYLGFLAVQRDSPLRAAPGVSAIPYYFDPQRGYEASLIEPTDDLHPTPVGKAAQKLLYFCEENGLAEN